MVVAEYNNIYRSVVVRKLGTMIWFCPEEELWCGSFSGLLITEQIFTIARCFLPPQAGPDGILEKIEC